MSEETQDVPKSQGTITIRKDSLWKYLTVILGVALILVVAFGVLPGKSTTGNVVAPTGQPGQNLPTGPAAKVEVSIGDAPLKGNSDSKVVILEWSDYECPFCARFFEQSLPSILKEDVQLGFKDFPLGFHQQAEGAANAARCAGEEGKYWEMHDLLFKQGVQGGVSDFKSYASQLGLSIDSCIDSNKYSAEIQKDVQEGSTAGIRGTPGFVLGTKKGDKVEGRLISGACPASTFTQAIAAEEAGKDWAVTNCQFTEF
tara:strand:+ start:185 stop:955 length:771 start_codon:yes stop_codon:yes gene_type:complete